MIERHRADAVGLKRQADIGLRLDRVHVEHLGMRSDGAHGRELAGRSDIEAVDAGGGQGLQHDRLAVGLHGIGGAAGEGIGESARIGGEHVRPEAIDRHVGPQLVGGIAGGGKALHQAKVLPNCCGEGARRRPGFSTGKSLVGNGFPAGFPYGAETVIFCTS